MPFKEKMISAFNHVKGTGRLWWLQQLDEYPKVIMFDVIVALLPTCIFGTVIFGLRALAVLLISVASAVLLEFLWNLILKKEQTVGDFSAVVTGCLFGMCLPSTVPLWVIIAGNVFAVIFVKQLLGGLGYNLTNPAATSLVLLGICFPKIMTDFVEPFYATAADTASYSFANLFFGLHSGGIGETSSLLLIVGGIYLIIRKIISPIIPITFIGSVALLNLIFSGDVLLNVFGTSLILAAFFMATDYTTSPSTNSGKLIFGTSCGILSFVFDLIFKNFDGVFLAIVIMNLVLVLYNRLNLRKYKDRAVAKVFAAFGKIKNLLYKKTVFRRF